MTRRYWWGYSAYVIEEGQIVPGKGARLVEHNDGVDPGEWPDERPYNTLLRILPHARLVQAGNAYVPDADTAELITEWCSANGPLCPILHEMMQVTVDGETSVRIGGRWAPPKRLAWGRGSIQLDSGEGVFHASEEGVGNLVHFFKRGEIAAPGTPEFIRRYREPVYTFIRAAQQLEWALEAAGNVRQLALGGPKIDDPKFARRVTDGLEILRRILAGCSVEVGVGWLKDEREPGGIGSGVGVVRRWVSASHLAGLAFAALRDLEENAEKGGGVRRCPEDNSLFVGLTHQAKFCSKRCRQAAMTRTYRERLRAKAKGGKSGKKAR